MTFPSPFYRWRPPPWPGLETGEDPPSLVLAYIEITPFDLIKYEVDKTTGYLRVDRPQRSSSQPPALYGFIPRTYCGEEVAKLSPASNRGDADPLDICVLSERPIDRSEVILNARVIGGLQVVDQGEADDKIIAVLDNDNIWGGDRVKDLGDLPDILIERLSHYFSTYKLIPGGDSAITVERLYGYGHALKVVEAAIADYNTEFGGN